MSKVGVLILDCIPIAGTATISFTYASKLSAQPYSIFPVNLVAFITNRYILTKHHLLCYDLGSHIGASDIGICRRLTQIYGSHKAINERP